MLRDRSAAENALDIVVTFSTTEDETAAVKSGLIKAVHGALIRAFPMSARRSLTSPAKRRAGGILAHIWADPADVGVGSLCSGTGAFTRPTLAAHCCREWGL